MHTNTSAPVDHGGVAGVDVDADAVAGSGISGAADGVQALRRGNIRIKFGVGDLSGEFNQSGEIDKTHSHKVDFLL